MIEIKVDASKIKGKIKPMHCANNCPINGLSMKQMHYWGEAGIPYSRLHDTGGEFGGTVFVDIDNIFINPDADENLPDSYRFEFTDYLLENIRAQGSEPFYRLGCGIENYRHIRPVHINPPKDPYKWARVCEHIIAHYNCGWADGYHMGITYWEIWNEPDNQPDMSENPMWNGNREQYYELYTITANHLKKVFPDIKVGGYASCGFYEILNANPDTTAHISTRTEYFIEFFEGFLEHITSQAGKAPLDFFSWHSYSGVEENIAYASYARDMLDRYGFKDTESIFNEWNPGIYDRGKLIDAMRISEMMIRLHDTSIDMMMYYDGQINTSYGGMFDPLTKTPFPAFYSFKAFNMLYRLGDECLCEVKENGDGGVFALAAFGKAEKKSAVMLVNTSESEKIVNISDGEADMCDFLLLDDAVRLEPVPFDGDSVKIPPYATAVAIYNMR